MSRRPFPRHLPPHTVSGRLLVVVSYRSIESQRDRVLVREGALLLADPSNAVGSRPAAAATGAVA